MRVHQITCPSCQSPIKSKAGVPVGQSVACPKCKHKFTVQAVEEADVLDEADLVDDFEVIDDFEVVDEAPPKKKSPPPVPGSAKSRDDDERPARAKPRRNEDEDERPARKRPARDDDDSSNEIDVKPARKRPIRDEDDEEEDERPTRKKARGSRDDDEDERPRRPKKKKRRSDFDDDEPEMGLYSRLKHNIWVRVITMLILLTVLAVLGYMLYEKRQREAAANAQAPIRLDQLASFVYGSSASSTVHPTPDGRKPWLA